ncbi:MAG: AraC family transcriptional regulator [Blastocatellia bacterium]|nr:AraC family transcriptional regulator [Blastocatellia bacterium]
MPQHPEPPISFQVLFSSPLIGLNDYHCRVGRSGPAEEEFTDLNKIVLMRSGVFCKCFGRRHITADVNQAVFFSKDSTYRVSHPGDCGDRGTVFSPAPEVLTEIVQTLNPNVEEAGGKPFPFITGPCENHLFQRHRQLIQRLEKGGSADPLQIEVQALQLVADVVEAAFAHHSLPTKTRKKDTESDHADRVEAVKTFLAGRFDQRITLEEIARAAFSSPFHLARIFQRKTGIPIHRYQNRLRLRFSLERLAEGVTDLTALALELGFSSHSHFCDAFRQEFGRPPSAVRQELHLPALREMSKILEV